MLKKKQEKMHTLKLTAGFYFVCQPERYFLSNQKTTQYNVPSYVVHLSSDWAPVGQGHI